VLPATAQMENQFYFSMESEESRKGLRRLAVYLQKQLILCHLQEAYVYSNEHNPEMLPGISKLVELRTKKSFFPETSSKNAVCAYTIHQNAKLEISEAKLYDLFGKQVRTYDDFLKNYL
jgi:hypothetical protein